MNWKADIYLTCTIICPYTRTSTQIDSLIGLDIEIYILAYKIEIDLKGLIYKIDDQGTIKCALEKEFFPFLIPNII